MQTYFGYEAVSFAEKKAKVGKVFSSVANKYDLMNDLMSLGWHRLWKKLALAYCALAPEHQVLDLATGTGDLARSLYDLLEPYNLTLADINASMLDLAKEKLTNQGKIKLNYVQTDAQALCFKDNSFDCVTIAFGLRNIPNIPLALAEIYRVLKPGARLVILEFSQVLSLKAIYDFYILEILPKLGAYIANDAASYRYLAESIKMHPKQEELLSLLTVCFSDARYVNIFDGLVAIHQGFKY